MGTLQFALSVWDSRSSLNSLTAFGPYCVLMLSAPAPMPISIMPLLIALAMSTQAWSPLEHCLFKLLTDVVTGKPAVRAAARNSVAPPPGARTAPTAMSSTSLGSMPERSMRALRAPWRRSDAWVSLSPPFPPLVKGVRRAQVMTIYSTELVRAHSFTFRKPQGRLPEAGAIMVMSWMVNLHHRHASPTSSPCPSCSEHHRSSGPQPARGGLELCNRQRP